MEKLKLRFGLSLWLPLFAVLLSAAIVLVPANRTYRQWKSAIGSGDRLMLSTGELQMIIPRERMLRSAFETNAIREQGTIVLLNAPGYVLGALASQLVVHHARGFPDSLGLFLWRVLSAPLFAIPAWFFVGRGIDGLLMRQRMIWFDLVMSAILVLLSLVISVGLRFGLSASERTGDDLLVYFITGFAWWSLLFAFPLSAWVRQKVQRAKRASVRR